MEKTVWIDLDNPPHVLLFKPIIADLHSQGMKVIVTARDHAYTCELLDEENISYRKIGRYYGKNIFKKVSGTLIRAFELVTVLRREKIDVAVSHGSRSMVVACFFLSIPCVTMFDYEYVYAGLFIRFSKKILLPELANENVLWDQGLKRDRLVKYPGMKEEIYFDSIPRNSGDQFHFIDENDINVLVRPPAETAHYHNAVSEKTHEKLLTWLLNQERIKVIVSPRTKDQYKKMKEKYGGNPRLILLDTPVNGLALIEKCDLVVGGGGTMNREASLFSVPVYSTFGGTRGAIDSYLESQGKLTFISAESDFEKIKLVKRKKSVPVRNSSGMLREFIIKEILATAKN